MTRIIVNPKIMLGKPVVKGTRITVEQILRFLEQKLSLDEILGDFPQLTKEDIREAVRFAIRAVAKPDSRASRYLHEIHH